MNGEELFFDEGPLRKTDTSVSLDIIMEEEVAKGTRGWGRGRGVVEGGIMFNPEACRVVFIEPEEQFSSPLLQVDRAKWDIYLVTMPFTLKETRDDKFYERVKFAIAFTDTSVQALDLFPNNVTSDSPTLKTYALSPRLSFTFEGLSPIITALGEGHNAFYWLYESYRMHGAVPHGSKRIVALIQLPRGRQQVRGYISCEFLLKNKRGFLGEAKPVGVEPYPFEWSLTDAASFSTKDRSHNTTAVILTTQAVEYEAIRVHLTALKEKVHQQGTIYEEGEFSDGCLPWKVILAEVSASSTTIASETERIIAHYKPGLIFLVGTAAGIQDVRPGDVIAATKVEGYESGKAERTFKLRPVIFNSSYRLEQRARAEARKQDWLHRLEQNTLNSSPCVHIGPIASGDREVASASSSTWSFLRAHFNDALAVEIGDHAFLDAVRANSGVEALVVRGVSHRIDEKNAWKEDERRSMVDSAARHASAFVFEMLAKLGCNEHSTQ